MVISYLFTSWRHFQGKKDKMGEVLAESVKIGPFMPPLGHIADNIKTIGELE